MQGEELSVEIESWRTLNFEFREKTQMQFLKKKSMHACKYKRMDEIYMIFTHTQHKHPCMGYIYCKYIIWREKKKTTRKKEKSFLLNKFWTQLMRYEMIRIVISAICRRFQNFPFIRQSNAEYGSFQITLFLSSFVLTCLNLKHHSEEKEEETNKDENKNKNKMKKMYEGNRSYLVSSLPNMLHIDKV